MHDLSLGPPVEDGVHPNATHKGPCFDGVYGCHLCWDRANDGKGTVSTCERCKAENVHTLIVRRIYEPVMYAACKSCREIRQRELNAIADELDDYHDDSFFDARDEDYE